MEPSFVVDFADRLPPAIRRDYLARRTSWFVERAGVPNYAAGPDAYDDVSYTVLATDGQECLGGVRATVRFPGDPMLLPLEKQCRGLYLPRLFPQLRLDETPHAEFSRLLVQAHGRPLALTNDIAYRLFRFLLLEQNPQPAVRYVFSWSNQRSDRLYQRLGNAFGLEQVVVPVPDELVPEALRQGEADRPGGGQVIRGYVLPPQPLKEART